MKALTREGNKKSAHSFEIEFEVWAVFDADNNSAGDVAQAKERAKVVGVNVAFSNPCFEIWPLMHFQDVDGPITHNSAQKALKRRMPKYDHSRGAIIDYESIRLPYDAAIKRAKFCDHRRREEGIPENNPFTGVFRLTEAIRIAAKAIPFE
jgi:hypothetical protein